MRIVIDLQGAQASNKSRGIGRYTLSLAQAIIRNRGNHEVIIALNGLFPETIEPIRAAFNDLLPQENIRVWVAPSPVSHIESTNNWRRKSAELLREAFLASLQPDVIYVSSFFEGLGDDAVTSLGLLFQSIPTAVTLYDLIPLINRNPYLENPVVESWYEDKLDQLRKADVLLAISESSRQEGIDYLSFSEDRSINVGTAADPQFRCIAISNETESSVRKRYGLSHSFLMYTGGIDYRKNIEGLIRSYALLPKSLREKHQLAIVCSVQPESKHHLEVLAKQQGLAVDEVIMTGFVPEEDLIALYHLCKAFIFPSWHEGFGLPALEAMSCGAAVIAANTSSLPEVIGWEDALFNPHDDKDIAKKITQVLTDSTYRAELIRRGLEQTKKFSWDESAHCALKAFELLHATKQKVQEKILAPEKRPKLAYISPLPPERTGIADYSAELLPELSRHYDIDVIVVQELITDSWVRANCTQRTIEWFKSHSNDYERVLYHFGNSPFHQHMFELLEEVPGCVVLHDFFLGHVTEYIGAISGNGNTWPLTLYSEYGYSPLEMRFKGDVPEIAWKYPCNRRVLSTALGVIVHTDYSIQLATSWYGSNAADNWNIIPLLRTPMGDCDQSVARRILQIAKDEFVVCSFGMLGPNKYNHRLLESWLASALASNEKCILVFVGENASGDYGAKLLDIISKSGIENRIRITGWTDAATFKYYLTAANVAVQLRTLSRGETSAAVLDCMNHGLATIVNANGSMADLSDEGVWKLPDEFENLQLTNALETLWQEPIRCEKMGIQAQNIIYRQHSPQSCADQYAEAIESMYRTSVTNVASLISALLEMESETVEDNEWVNLASDIALSIPPKLQVRQLLVDISELVQRDSKTGIQRVVRNILRELLNNPPAGYRVEPVYATSDSSYSYARLFTCRFLDYPDCFLTDDPIDFQNGDIFLGLDLQHHVVMNNKSYYQKMRSFGVQVNFVVYDLLPISHSHCFVSGAADLHGKWLQVLASCDGVLCISHAVAIEMLDWFSVNGTPGHRPFNVEWFHLGADIDCSVLTNDLPANNVLNAISAHPSFLMVGTIEPRKGHIQTLRAFEQLWLEQQDVNLVIVGKQGWVMEEFIEKLSNHPELNNRLFWLEGISDEYLEKVYAVSTCLIAASEGEGFGLPLIEAAQHKLPIIARDIPVFREVAGEYAYYFDGNESNALIKAIQDWLKIYRLKQHPSSEEMPWLTWKESANQLLEKILK